MSKERFCIAGERIQDIEFNGDAALSKHFIKKIVLNLLLNLKFSWLKPNHYIPAQRTFQQ